MSPSNPDGKPIYMPGPNVQIQFSSLLMQRRTDLWGQDALEYKPERWLDPKSLKQISSDPFKFIPFSAGPRICLGQNFAYNEASFRESTCLLLLSTTKSEGEIRWSFGSRGSSPSNVRHAGAPPEAGRPAGIGSARKLGRRGRTASCRGDLPSFGVGVV